MNYLLCTTTIGSLADQMSALRGGPDSCRIYISGQLQWLGTRFILPHRFCCALFRLMLQNQPMDHDGATNRLCSRGYRCLGPVFEKNARKILGSFATPDYRPFMVPKPQICRGPCLYEVTKSSDSLSYMTATPPFYFILIPVLLLIIIFSTLKALFSS